MLLHGIQKFIMYAFLFILVYTEEFSFQELPWSQRQTIFFESSQIGEYLFHLAYKKKYDIER